MLKGFISYAHDDYAAFDAMRSHLRAVERAFKIDFWADKRISAGNYWSDKIADAIEAAQIHILMFSPAFIESDYIFDHELRPLPLQRRPQRLPLLRQPLSPLRQLPLLHPWPVGSSVLRIRMLPSADAWRLPEPHLRAVGLKACQRGQFRQACRCKRQAHHRGRPASYQLGWRPGRQATSRLG
jgi:hypothetical protein